MRVLIRGAGDIATGIALRLKRAGLDVIMIDIANPTAIRRTVCLSQAILHGETTVEDVKGVYCANTSEIEGVLQADNIPVLVDEDLHLINDIQPDVLVDAILAKKNLGTKMTDAPIVIGVGPGFTATVDCHACIETMRGHTLGRVIYEGSPIPNTAVPGLIGGYAGERVLRAPCDGTFHLLKDIGSIVEEGETVATVNDEPIKCTIAGVLRGILANNTPVFKGMKSGDVDPRCKVEYCYSVSDKASAVGGGVLEAILHLTGVLK